MRSKFYLGGYLLTEDDKDKVRHAMSLLGSSGVVKDALEKLGGYIM